MKAGASARTLAFPEHYFPVEGFSKVIDPLRARVLVLEQDLRCAILVLDMTSLPPEEIDALSGILKAETGAAYTVCLVTHTFSAPHFMPDGRLKTQAERDRKRTLQEIVYQAVRRPRQKRSESCGESPSTEGAHNAWSILPEMWRRQWAGGLAPMAPAP